MIIGCSEEDCDFRTVVQSHLQRYPELEVQDLYKLTFQASMGNEHYLSDSSKVLSYLLNELAQVDSSRSQPLTNNISVDNEIVRLNLAQFKARGGDPQRLVEAMFASAERFEKSPKRLQHHWKIIGIMAEKNTFPFSPDALNQFWAKVDSLGFPAVHHSEIYSENYAPHYRVILRSELSRLNMKLVD